MRSLENQLADAKADVERLEAEIAAEPYPVGTIVAVNDSLSWSVPIYAIRHARVHLGAANSDRKTSTTPVWVSIFNDFSGETYPSYAALRKKFHNAEPEVIFQP